jgi:protocatechuate 3,4-dioxygenase beta subunit
MNPAASTFLVLASALAQLPPSPDPRPVPISGVVVDASDRPVGGAEVWLAEAVPPAEGRRAGTELLGPVPAGPVAGVSPALAHARTDAAGRFAVRIPAEVVARPSPPPLAIWAASLGQGPRVAWYRLPRAVLGDDPPVRIALGDPARSQVRIVDPDRKPVAGARIVPTRADETLVPGPLGRALAATSDADGRATIAGLAPGLLEEVSVSASGFGVLVLEMPDSGLLSPAAKRTKSGDDATTIALARVGRVAGRLVAAGNEPIRGVTVRADTRVDGYAGSGQGGFAHVACDEQGRFDIPAIAAGMMNLRIEYDPEQGTMLRNWPLSRILVRAGRTTEVAIPLHPTVKVQGMVRERGTERPIAGAAVMWNGFFDGRVVAVADASGMFRGFVAREDILATPTPIGVPGPWFVPVDRAKVLEDLPPRGVDELTLKTIDLPRGVEMSGTVVDERGEPVAGAAVEAIRPTPVPWVRLARADSAGRFTLHGADPRAELVFRAWDGLAGSAAVSYAPDALTARPIVLTVGPGHTAPIGGRVVDPAGRPVAGASVRLWREVRPKNEGSLAVAEPLVHCNGSAVLRTDAQGRYRTTRRFPADCAYVAEATAPGRPPVRSAAITLSERDHEFPPMVLRRLRTVEGRVVDRQGQPVAGALVSQSGDGPMPTETTSGADGHFALPGVLEGPAIVFARKDEFRVQFQPVDGDTAPIRIALTRTNESPAAAYKTLPPALPAGEEKALARRLIQPEADRVLARGDDGEKGRLLRHLAAIEPADALERLEAAKLADPDVATSIRITAAEALAGENLDEGLAVVEALSTPDNRAHGYLTIGRALPDLEPGRARTLLDQAIVNARAATHENWKIYLLEQISGRLIDLGEVERAKPLIREGEELVRKAFQGRALYSRLADFAGLMLRVDPTAALPKFEELRRQADGGKVTVRAFGLDRHYGLAAYHLAARHPAAAERLLHRLSFALVRPANTYIVAVCARMAPADLPRARKLVDLITQDERVLEAYALGLMAGAIASDKPAALTLLDDAYTELEHLADSGWTSQFASICGVAGRLLPIVEQVDASRLPEFLARALALRPPVGGRNDHAFFPEQTASLSMTVARYDRGLAARLVRPELDTLGTAPSPRSPVSPMMDSANAGRVLAALALVEPRQAVERIEQLAHQEGTRKYDGPLRIQAATMLALQGLERLRHIDVELALPVLDQGVD